MSVALHQITATDEQACPRWETSDGVSIPMPLMPDQGDQAEEREISPSPGEA